MPSINIRNLPDDLHERISRTASRSERSLEGEVRYALANAYPNSTGLTLKQEWMQATAERLRQLHFQLKTDNFWRHHRSPGTLTELARQIGEDSPARLLAWMDGHEPITFEGAKRIEAFTGCSADWLMDGTSDMFPVEDIGHYTGFFLPETPGNYEFHLIRYGKGDGLVPLHVIRYNSVNDSFASGQMMGRFYLGMGMGSTGTGNLKRFLIFLKKHSWKLKLRSYTYDPANEEAGSHHPTHILDSDRLNENNWLDRLFKGQITDSWADEFSWVLDEVKNAPVGSPEEDV
ncbi:hypothetical protein [Pantoea sp. DY-17]|uniref:FitA-like ribbon-helix-helix domain-containing protein n=1 Tax=Pantoea sp. DY-17 TaxID=2871490 RepID=UPI001C956EB3|nr:hypothetical protein [Pantoea sp. DY-17]MBY4954535.1 hypothetical protein [Pantoea sp. DY-17]